MIYRKHTSVNNQVHVLKANSLVANTSKKEDLAFRNHIQLNWSVNFDCDHNKDLKKRTEKKTCDVKKVLNRYFFHQNKSNMCLRSRNQRICT